MLIHASQRLSMHWRCQLFVQRPLASQTWSTSPKSCRLSMRITDLNFASTTLTEPYTWGVISAGALKSLHCHLSIYIYTAIHGKQR